MSSIGASNNNPNAYIQAMLQRGKPPSSAAQGDAPSQTFTAVSPQSTSAPAPAAAASPSAAKSGSGGTFPKFEPQTLQTLLALQAAGS
jgi:hypothetical protein